MSLRWASACGNGCVRLHSSRQITCCVLTLWFLQEIEDDDESDIDSEDDTPDLEDDEGGQL